MRRVLAFYLGSRSGRNNFEGLATERVYTLVAREVLDYIEEHRLYRA